MKTKSHSISGAFVFTLLGAFAVFSMLLVVLGAQAYRTTVDGASAHTRKRIAAAFVRNAVRRTSGARLPWKTGTACRCWR